MDAKRCICKGRDFQALLAAWFKRTRPLIAEGTRDGKPTWSYDNLRKAVTLIRALSEGREKGPFQGKFRHLDHHLEECPCSPRYVAPKADAEA